MLWKHIVKTQLYMLSVCLELSEDLSHIRDIKNRVWVQRLGGLLDSTSFGGSRN